MKEILIIHGWEDNGESYWIPWLKNELEQLGFKVYNPSFPNSQRPILKDWLTAARKVSTTFNTDWSIVAYSSGFTFALQLLASFSQNERIDKFVGLAPFDCPLSFGAGETADLYKPPIDYTKVNGKSDKVYLIASDNDPYIPLTIPKRIQESLHADLQIVHAGMMNKESGYRPSEVIDLFK